MNGPGTQRIPVPLVDIFATGDDKKYNRDADTFEEGVITMAEHPNVEVLRRGHEAFAKGDMNALAEIIAEDTVWHWSGRSQISGTYRGREAVFGAFAKIAELSEGTFRIQEDHDFLGTDGHGVALFRITATRGGKTLNVNACEVVHVRNGQVVEEWLSFDDQYAADDFWA